MKNLRRKQWKRAVCHRIPMTERGAGRRSRMTANHRTPKARVWGIGGLNVAAKSCVGRHSSFTYTDKILPNLGIRPIFSRLSSGASSPDMRGHGVFAA